MMMNKHVKNAAKDDDVFTLYSLLESRIEMLEEKVLQLSKEIVTLKAILNEEKRGI
jgi:uncharacterized protein (DUF342 family)